MKELSITKNILNENSDILKDFFRDINKYKIYSGEEQIQLAREAKAGNQRSREKLINSNLRFVVTCAKKYVKQGVPLLDLIQAGLLGLVQSVDYFDPDKGYKFLSFAVWYIRREILKEIYNTGRTIRYPITYIGIISKVKKAYEKFIAEHQREPSEDELIKAADISKRQYKSIIMNKSYCQSFDTPLLEDESITLKDTLSEEITPFSDSFTKEEILDSLKCLTDREYKVIMEFYGLNNTDKKSIKEIAEELGLGDERVRQLRKSAIKKLQQKKGNILKTLL